MPFFMTQGRYTSSALKGMVRKPEDRTEAVANLFKEFGGKLHHIFLAAGFSDWVVIGEFPDLASAVSAIAVVAAGGSIADPVTTALLTPAETVALMRRAGPVAERFRSAGT